MNKKLYEQMDWPRIEAIVYSEECMPYDVLGPHVIKQGIIIQTFIPYATKVALKDLKDKKKYSMELVDDAGFYSVLLPRKRKIPDYVFVIETDNGEIIEQRDPYSFQLPFSEEDFEEFGAGTDYNVYQKLGAHLLEIEGIKGTVFTVWAPNAIRVSVIGEFNQWDGRIHQMHRIGNTGVFELFLPDVNEKSCYKFEIKKTGNYIINKIDPYGFKLKNICYDIVSVIVSSDNFVWEDDKWICSRIKNSVYEKPMSILEIQLEDWISSNRSDVINYKNLALEIADYAKEMGYTHILCSTIMETDQGNNVISYYAPKSKLGTSNNLKEFVNILHQNEIGVILDWIPSYFSDEYYGLGEFDGSCLYEDNDLRKRKHGENGKPMFHYARSQVQNFLMANALYWIEEFHIDGLRLCSLASMLYLDYYKRAGQWVPNIYGGNEDLEAVAFIKLLNKTIKKRTDGVVMLAEDDSLWPGVTESLENDGLGFDFKQNMGWTNDFLEYMFCDPFYRSNMYEKLTLSMLYAYCEKYLLCLPGNKSLLDSMPGDSERKLANFKVSIGYMMMHPGRKMLKKGEETLQIKKYLKEIMKLYHSEPALSQLEDLTDGFEWINNISSKTNIIVFLRKSKDEKDNLIVICNFSSSVYSKYKIGIPIEGNYKEIFNSDAETFDGIDIVNRGIIKSAPEECDGRENSICIKLPPIAMLILKRTN
ncbi:1,4-alpha-glucan branching enzyme [Anaerosacchariphilus polymeriproducens]|uniref:1,4-alpha-glucan branching enzyme n=1 Tax=Anaerosacchariphilus polymeriproducens TaxID=1812858 RepID=A0A371AUS0_9FIRM|nr:1,4-alpha-glucan branching enzyme [Anaerosacchariphilus polymeriproducens]RDU23289.1 1,4-alpha-glucan branching enzyme [Anaerosacchariphilus polymeriproducens]